MHVRTQDRSEEDAGRGGGEEGEVKQEEGKEGEEEKQEETNDLVT